MRSDASEVESKGSRARTRAGLRGKLARSSTLRRMALEGLEARTMLSTTTTSTLPSPAVALNSQINLSGSEGSESTPSIAIDKNNPQKMAAVWVRNDPLLAPGTTVFIEYAYSNNGGASWSGPQRLNNIINPTTSNPVVPYAQATDPSIAFDRNDNFYILDAQHGTGATAAPTALVLNKFNFSGATPTHSLFDHVVYESLQDAAVSPMLAVDDNLKSFTDTDSNGKPYVQSDPTAGSIYIAWATNNTPPQNAQNYNPNEIQLIASSDGGSNFSGPITVDTGGAFGSQRYAAPRLTISQGRPADAFGNPAVPGGQVTLVYDDFGSGTQAQPVPVDLIWSTVVSGASSQVFTGPGGPITDATNDNPSVITPTNFPVNVNITDAGFVSLSHLSVTLTVTHPSVADLSFVLIPPTGSGLPNVTLIAAGTISGANLGVTTTGVPVGTVLTDFAARAINNQASTSPYVGTYGAETNLDAVYAGATKAQLNGTWTLQITDTKNGSAGSLGNWSLNLVSGMQRGAQTLVTTSDMRGALGNTYPIKTPNSPLGVSPGATIASDNTVGAYSEFEGRLYITYVDHVYNANRNQPNNTDIFMRTSDDGGRTWSAPQLVNDDEATNDGFSESNSDLFDVTTGRTQSEPEIQVDAATGTVFLSWLDSRVDASNSRVATYLAASSDGGASFAPQVYANVSQMARDGITDQLVNLGPIPESQLVGTDTTFGFGTHQGLAVYDGKAFPAWSSNLNGGSDGKQLLDIRTVKATFAAGPRVIASTMGAVKQQTITTVNGPVTINGPDANGAPTVSGFTVTFDRPVDPSTFTTSDISVFFRDTTQNNVSGAPVPVNTVAPIPTVNDPNNPNNVFGYTQFLVTFAARSAVGTYSYEVNPDIRDRIRTVSNGVTSQGNRMDQNADGVAGQQAATGVGPGDVYAAPRPTGGAGSFVITPGQYLPGPYDPNTLPLVLGGPHLVSSSIPGASPSSDNLVTNQTVSAIDITFDRPMDPSSITPGSILRIMGPSGAIPLTTNGVSDITITPNPLGNDADPSHPRTYRISFPTQYLSGTYTITLASTIKSAAGDELDTNQNAGVDLLKQTPSGTSVAVTFNSTNVPTAITSGSTTTSVLNVPAGFLTQDLTLTLNITYPNDPDLEATLIGPDGTQVKLFTNVGSAGGNPGFSNTVFDDKAGTPIQNGGPPFLGRFIPQQPLSAYNGKSAAGQWTLVIKNDAATSTGRIGSLVSWSLTFQKAVPISGLGEPVADQATVGFRLFTDNATNPLTSDTWTSVGPGTISNNPPGNGYAGSVSTIAVDPSDSSGNTVYVGSASGGVWKTTNFLTTNPAGPTYVPLTDFGPTFGVNVGSIAVFGRNNDPNQSIILVGTGNANAAPGNGAIAGNISQGVGFLLSTDGGASWTLLDSTNNTLPFASRDHMFAIDGGTTTYKVMVDPRPSPTGQVIMYAALGGTHGGLWRSIDTGQHWQLMKAGTATDVTFDLNSATVDVNSNPTGNVNVIYAAFQGEGVYISPNRGQNLNLMAGGNIDPLIRDPENLTGAEPQPIPVGNGTFPTGSGRITLAKPALVPSNKPRADVENLLYEGWIYAAVANPNGHTIGLYLTKDNGTTWTRIYTGTVPSVNNGVAQPSNNPSQPLYDTPGSPTAPWSNYNLSVTVDPNNPSIVYLGGTSVGQTSGLIRIDASNLYDSHAAVAYDGSRAAGGTQFSSVGRVALKDVNRGTPVLEVLRGNQVVTVTSQQYINLIQDPTAPFLTNSTLYLSNVASFTNDGSGITWTPFDELLKSSANDFEPSTNIHQMISIIDPLTGNARLIVADDQGVFTGVDLGNGNISAGIGNQASPTYSRNGNLQAAQFYYGAAQPSNVAAQIAQAMFYGNGLHTGVATSDPGEINPNDPNNGNVDWSAPTQDTGNTGTLSGEIDGVGVQVSQQGGMADPNNPGQKLPTITYQYVFPGLGGGFSDFFQVSVNGTPFTSRTTGLVQVANDPQWPIAVPQYPNGVVPGNFAVNPVDGNEVIISSDAGRIFSTINQGKSWLVIGDPASLDSTYAPALAFGAPDPNGPAGVGNLNNFLYAGTVAGHIFVSQTGGGTIGSGNAWTDISTGLDGSPVMKIVTDPTRGSHDAYAVTQKGVYYTANSLAGTGTIWTNITGNLFNFQTAAFNNQDLTDQRIAYLTSIVADWRYAIPNSTGAGSHPVLYVSGEPGVYRSLDNGKTWSIYPDNTTTNGTTPLPSDSPAPPPGGMLPNVHVNDLSLAIGNIDPTTGRPIAVAGDPNNLVASTLGRGTYTIRLAPIVFPNTDSQPDSIHLDTTLPPPGGSQSGTAQDGTPLVTVPRPVIDGTSEQSAFGNTVYITIYDLTNPSSPRIIGGYDPTNPSTANSANQTDEEAGNFSIQINAGAFTFNGIKTLGIQATDASGTKGNMATFTFTLNANLPLPNPPATPSLALSPIDDSSHGNNVTNVVEPSLIGATDPSTQVQIFKADSNGHPTGPALITGQTDATGNYLLKFATPLADGVYTVVAQASNAFGDSNSKPFTFTIDTHGPTSAPTLILSPDSDTGIKGDNITSARTPFFSGVTEPFAIVDLYDASTFNPSNPSGNKVLSETTADDKGNYSFQLPFSLTNGAITLVSQARDVAGNVGPVSAALSIQVITVAADYNNDGKSDLALFGRTSPLATWQIQGVTSSGGTTFGSGTQSIPVEGDFIGNGRDQLAYYNPNTATWFIQGLYPNGIQFGMALVDIPVPGDYFGTHVDTIATYRPTTGEWFIGGSPNGAIKLGSQGDIPVPGDYDGIGRTEPAVYTPSTGTFTIYNPLTSQTRSVQLGSPGLIPVPGQYDNSVNFHKTEPAVFDPVTGVMTILGPNNTTRTLQFAQGSIPAPNDYDGNGIDEPAAFLPATGTWTIYPPQSNTATTKQFGQAGEVPVAAPYNYRKLPVQGDYVGDGFAQFTLFRRTGPQATWYIGGVSGPNGTKLGGPNDVPVQGDFNGNGLADLASFNSSTATWTVQGLYPNGVQYGAANLDIPAPADYYGVGTTTIGVFRPTTGEWFVAGQGAAQAKFGAGMNNIPVPGNYDGSGKAEFAVFEPATAAHPTQWQIMGANGLQTIAYGGANDVPVPADYDGVGETQLAVYRPSTQQWFIAGHGPIQFGGAGDIPVPGDYDGVGHVQLAVYRPSTNQLFIAGHPQPITFGGKGDVPVQAPYVYRVPGNTIVAASVSTETNVGNADNSISTPPPASPDPSATTDVTISAAATTAPPTTTTNTTTPPAQSGSPRPNQQELAKEKAEALVALRNASHKHQIHDTALSSIRGRFGRLFG